VTYTVTKMPPGLKLSNATGLITGVPTTAGDYAMTVTAKNADSVADDTLAFTIHVSALAKGLVGVFHGLVDRNPFLNANFASRLELTTTPLGACTGTLTTGTTATSLKGALATGTATGATIVMPIPSLRATLSVTLDAATGTLDGTLSDGGANSADVHAWRNAWAEVTGKAAAVKGLYTFYLDQTDPNVGLPQGYGYGSFTVDGVTGKLTFGGQTARRYQTHREHACRPARAGAALRGLPRRLARGPTHDHRRRDPAGRQHPRRHARLAQAALDRHLSRRLWPDPARRRRRPLHPAGQG
jgi:hypothetical protein